MRSSTWPTSFQEAEWCIHQTNISELGLTSFFPVGVSKCQRNNITKDHIGLIQGFTGKDMGDGWETKRSRQPGHKDWAILKL